MEEYRPNSNNTITKKTYNEYPIMTLVDRIPNPFICQVEKDTIRYNIENFCNVYPRIIASSVMVGRSTV